MILLSCFRGNPRRGSESCGQYFSSGRKPARVLPTCNTVKIKFVAITGTYTNAVCNSHNLSDTVPVQENKNLT